MNTITKQQQEIKNAVLSGIVDLKARIESCTFQVLEQGSLPTVFIDDVEHYPEEFNVCGSPGQIAQQILDCAIFLNQAVRLKRSFNLRVTMRNVTEDEENLYYTAVSIVATTGTIREIGRVEQKEEAVTECVDVKRQKIIEKLIAKTGALKYDAAYFFSTPADGQLSVVTLDNGTVCYPMEYRVFGTDEEIAAGIIDLAAPRLQASAGCANIELHVSVKDVAEHDEQSCHATVSILVIAESRSKKRTVFHIVAGSPEWEPTEKEMAELTKLFSDASIDEPGGVVVTGSTYPIQATIIDVQEAQDLKLFKAAIRAAVTEFPPSIK